MLSCSRLDSFGWDPARPVPSLCLQPGHEGGWRETLYCLKYHQMKVVERPSVSVVEVPNHVTMAIQEMTCDQKNLEKSF